MDPVSELAKKTRARGTLFFNQSKEPDPVKLSTLTFAGQIAKLNWAQEKIRKSRIEITDLPFDRLLLNTSLEYSKTRKLARKLGVKIVPEIVSFYHSLLNVDLATPVVHFASLSTEITWLAQKICEKKQRPDPFIAELNLIKNYVRAVYHELNHKILFSSIRPKKASHRDFSKLIEYFSLIEAMATYRDIQLGEELRELGAPLKWLGVIYRSYSSPAYSQESFERFKNVISYYYFRLTWNSDAEFWRQETLAKLGAENHREHLYLSDHFLNYTHKTWLDEYKSKHGSQLKLPKKSNTLNFQFENIEPQRLMKSEDYLRELYMFYNRIFE